MWSAAERGLFVKFFAVFFILACGVGAALTAVATRFFGYTGTYTPPAVAACLVGSMLGSWLARLKRRILRGDDVITRVKEAEAKPRQKPLQSSIIGLVQLPLIYFLWLGTHGHVGLAIGGAVAWCVVSYFIVRFVFKRTSRSKNSSSLTGPL
jgi:divalent metal cation (Fe/Co/Zn/Cd) transporter